MASMAETLTTKRGGVPTYVWGVGLVGLLVVVMLMRKKSAAKNQPAALQTNVLSPGVAASLTQGAAPMGYTGGNIYNNIAVQGGSATAIAPDEPTRVHGQPPPSVVPPVRMPAPVQAAPAVQQYGKYVIPSGSGQSYSYVANKFHVPGGAQALFKLNTDPNGPHSAAAANKLRQQGANLLYGGQIVYYPK